MFGNVSSKGDAIVQETDSTSSSSSVAKHVSLFDAVPHQGSGLFGAAAPHSAVGSLFDAASQSNGSLLTEAPPSGMFGGVPLQTGAVGSFFGTASQSSGSLFGEPPPSGLFSSMPPQTGAVGSFFGTASQSSGSLFGESLPSSKNNKKKLGKNDKKKLSGMFSRLPPQTEPVRSFFGTTSQSSGSLFGGTPPSGLFSSMPLQTGAVSSFSGTASQSSGSLFGESSPSGLFSSMPPQTGAVGSFFGTASQSSGSLFGESPPSGLLSSMPPQTRDDGGSLFGSAPQTTYNLFGTGQASTASSEAFKFAESEDPASKSLNLTVKLGSTDAHAKVAATGSWDVRQLISHVQQQLTPGTIVTKILAGMFKVPLVDDAKLSALGVRDGDVLDAVLVEERVYEVQLLGGTCFQVKLPSDSRVINLKEQIKLSGHVSAFFSLVAEHLEILLDETASLPAGTKLNVIQEDASSLCDAAQQVLRNIPKHVKELDRSELERCRLGRCCNLGTFPTIEWQDDPWMDECAVDNCYQIGQYNVLELTLIDGSDKFCSMVGVINEGDADCNTGFWGSVYLRPGFTEVAALTSENDESNWRVIDSSWYTKGHQTLPKCICALAGGKSAESSLETHLSHAVAAAYFGKLFAVN